MTNAAEPNIRFCYLYRDASNYKQHGEAVFTNHSRLSVGEIEMQIRAFLKDGEYFIARQVKVEERFFDALYEDDHPWHEFSWVEATTEPAFDPEYWNEHKCKRDITEFIAELGKAHHAGWDEKQVRGDVARLLARQKDELKRAFEAGEDVLE
ncbi:MAG: hypothetical protein DPW18_01515 [Chloroflexi bacterium]|nr:hypothetical protein [Chloroflexota bacterium]MDL1943693.1 hypothetical protein [Chloroflexi bacterium CFX2]